MKKFLLSILMLLSFLSALPQKSIEIIADYGMNTRLISKKNIADSTYKAVKVNELDGKNRSFGFLYCNKYKKLHYNIGIMYNRLNFYTKIVSYYASYNPTGDPHLLGFKFRYREDNIIVPFRIGFFDKTYAKSFLKINVGCDVLLNVVYKNYAIRKYDYDIPNSGLNTLWGEQNQKDNHFKISAQSSMNLKYGINISKNIYTGFVLNVNYTLGKSKSSEMNDDNDFFGIYQQEIIGHNVRLNGGLFLGRKFDKMKKG